MFVRHALVVVPAALGCSAIAHGQQAVQWGGNGHWYQVKQASSAISWTNARGLAEGLGGHLATLASQSENLWVYDSVASSPADWNGPQGPYLGGFRNPSFGWQWVTGEPWGFAAWGSGSPSGGSEAFLHFGNGNICFCPDPHWNDIDDLNPNWPIRAFIVEWSADCNDDGIVDYGQCRDGSLPDYNGNNVPDCCEAGVPCLPGNGAIQWRVADGGNGHWYSIVQSGFPGGTPGNWDDLDTTARSSGAMLCSIGSAAENEFVRALVTARGPINGFWCYLGGMQVMQQTCGPMSWIWNDGTPWSFTIWQPGQPDCLVGSCGSCDEPRMAIRSFSGEWGDWNLRDLNRAVFEWSADCNGDGIVDYGQILDGTFADVNSNGIPDLCEVDPCPGDINESGVVNAVDISMILSSWGTNGGKFPRADTNHDGTVDAQDLAVVLSGWGNCP
jgi:hypothetical protein